MNIQNKVFFLLPTYDYPPTKALAEIVSMFPHAQVIIINDNPVLDINNGPFCTVINNPQNLGLARTLLIGYKNALSLGAEIVIKVDPDLEYPLEPILEVVKELRLHKLDVGFIHFRRSLPGITLADLIFHTLFGLIESFFVGTYISQHSPGLQIYHSTALKHILVDYEKEIRNRKLRWGGDLLLLRIAKDLGFKIKGYQVTRNWPEKRDLTKIIAQGLNTLQIISGYRGVK